MSDKEIIFIAPLPAIRKRTRLVKMVSVLLDLDYHVAFFGWQRIGSELKEMPFGNAAVMERLILKGGGYSSKWARMMYPVWMIVVFFRVLFLGRKKTIFCLGWETAFPALLASFFTGSKIAFDDADRFSLNFKLPAMLLRVLQRLEQWASNKASLHIVPGYSRYEWRHDKMVVLKNSPTSADFEQARSRSVAKDSDALVLYANGWVGQTRGAPIFLKAIEAIQSRNMNVKMHIAGRVDSKDGDKLIGHPLVEYHGEVSQVEALSLYAKSDLVLTYYDPAVKINRLAESNKWGDCIYLKTPFIVNSEVKTAEKYVLGGAAFALDYCDANGLVNLVAKVLDDRSIIEKAVESLKPFEIDFPSYDEQFVTIISILEALQSE